MTENFVIVGAGLAGATAAEALREEGFDGTLQLFGAEDHLPYIRPPLSKEYFAGKAERDSIFVHEPAWYSDHDIEIESRQSVVGLEVAKHTITLQDGRSVPFDRLLLATGAAPRRVEVEGAQARGIHTRGIYYLRTVDDSERIRAELAGGGRKVVVVGAGWIGLELGAAAREYGNDVTLIGRESIPLEGPLGPELGSMFRELHEAHGVRFELPSSILSFAVADGRVTGVVTEAGTLDADVVIVGVDAIPNTELAQAGGLALGNGILVDEHLKTSADDVFVADIFAAGDVANAWHPVVGERMRNEHWANAIGTGKVAAASMLGKDAVFDEIPYFYTDQFDLGMEYSGYPPLTAGASVVYRGKRPEREFIAFWLADGKVVAGMNVNVWDVNETVQQLIRSQRVVDPARLVDESIDLAAV